jgi:hypothetical protein
MALRNGLYVMVVAEGEAIDAYSKHLGVVYVGRMPQQFRGLYISSLLDWLHERYSSEQNSFFFAPYYHGILYEHVDFREPTEIEMLKLMRKSKEMPDNRREMLKVAAAVARDMRQIIVETSKTADLPSSEPKSKPQSAEKPKQTRQRVSKDDITEAVKLVFDRGMTRSQAERARGLPQGALSKGKGKEQIKMVREALQSYKAPVDKDVGDDFVYNELRKNKKR